MPDIMKPMQKHWGIRRITLGQLKDELSAEEKKVIKAEMKEALEGLVGQVQYYS